MGAELNEETKSLIRYSLNMEKNILNLSLLKWKTKLKEFEDENNMSTKDFLDKFNKGKLGDDKIWFDWLFAYKAYINIENKLRLIKNIHL